MLKVKCPDCGSVKIDRINSQVAVYNTTYLEQKTDYFIEGGVEKPYTYYNLIADESEPPYIEELDSSDLEFICSDCQYKFEGVKTDDEFIRTAQEWGLIRWCM